MDEFAEDCFKAIGYKTPLPQELIDIYTRVKYYHDKLTPGRLSADTIALIAMLARDKISQKKEKKEE